MEKLNTNSSNSSKPPSQDPHRAKKKKKAVAVAVDNLGMLEKVELLIHLKRSMRRFSIPLPIVPIVEKPI